MTNHSDSTQETKPAEPPDERFTLPEGTTFTDKRCSICGCLRLSTGACSLIGCPDPLHDCRAEQAACSNCQTVMVKSSTGWLCMKCDVLKQSYVEAQPVEGPIK